MFGFSTSLAFFEPPSQKLDFPELDSVSGSFGSGLMSTGRETASGLPLLEVNLSGGAGGFSSSSDDILKPFLKLTGRINLDTYEDQREAGGGGQVGEVVIGAQDELFGHVFASF
jgi:hypothetical protein